MHQIAGFTASNSSWRKSQYELVGAQSAEVDGQW